MHILSLPDDALHSVLHALLARHTTAHGLVSLHSAALDIDTLYATHSRLRNALRPLLRAVLVDNNNNTATTSSSTMILRYTPHTLAIRGATVPLLPVIEDIPRLRVLTLVSVPVLPDTLRPHLHHLTHLTIIGGTCTIPHEITNLVHLKLRNVPNIHENTLSQLLTTKVAVVHIAQHYPVASIIARRCNNLQVLKLGANDTNTSDILAACDANSRTLQVLRLRARLDGDRALLNDSTLQTLTLHTPHLHDVDIGPLPFQTVLDTLKHRAKTVYIRDWSCFHTPHLPRALDWSSSNNVVHLPNLLHSELQSLRLCHAPADDNLLDIVANRTGSLRRLALDALPDVSVNGVAAILKTNGASLTHFSVGAKCRRLSNVTLMSTLAKHCPNLCVVSFPRWCKPVQSALDNFRVALPHADIRSAANLWCA